MQNMLWTPETSGGLLVSVPPKNVALFIENCPSAVPLGEVLPGDGRIIVREYVVRFGKKELIINC
jgi:hypothetical protein